jgi:hypothetical protein
MPECFANSTFVKGTDSTASNPLFGSEPGDPQFVFAEGRVDREEVILP